MKREYYSDQISTFLQRPNDEILGILAKQNEFSFEQTQRDAWVSEILILKKVLKNHTGSIYFEYSIPRMGRRIGVLLLIRSVIFVLEFKVGEKIFSSNALDQVWDYALDLKNFHETSHDSFMAPILIATMAKKSITTIAKTRHGDRLLMPIQSTPDLLGDVINNVIDFSSGVEIDPKQWEAGRYQPTPSIIEAAVALYNRHSVSEISRSDASSSSLRRTSETISEIIRNSRSKFQKSICFLTGVPGSGKTLVGLNVATSHFDKQNELYSVFLSGNGPLVQVLREALTRDKVRKSKESGFKTKKGEVASEVKLFIQNVHNFRDDNLIQPYQPPIEHVVLFDEAQRAWNLQQTANFMQRKRGFQSFLLSEPEFLISCLNRHPDWAVIVCLVGGGQEINTGEAGISEWINALERSFPDWHVYISPHLSDNEYSTETSLPKLNLRKNVSFKEDLHLAVSMRSFRAEYVSLLMKQLLDLQPQDALMTLQNIKDKYPIMITRELEKAKNWLRTQARGSERYGIIVSSQAERLKPHAIDVRSPVDPIHWFLNGKEDVRSSYYLEDVATEFQIQGLEIDWACVTWDADFRYAPHGWEHYSFIGNTWKHIRKSEKQNYLKNAYRVLLTRARQGMVIFVPPGDEHDPTRNKKFYDPTFNYLKKIGFVEI